MHCVVFAIWVLLIPALGVSEGCVGKPRVRCAFLHSLFYVILVASFFHCLLSWDVSVISNYSLSPILPPRPAPPPTPPSSAVCDSFYPLLPPKQQRIGFLVVNCGLEEVGIISYYPDKETQDGEW